MLTLCGGSSTHLRVLPGLTAGKPLRPLRSPVAAQALLHMRDDDARARARDHNGWRQTSLTLLRPAAMLQGDAALWARFTRNTPFIQLDDWHRGGWIGGLVGFGFVGMLLEVRGLIAHLGCVIDAT